MLEAGEREKRKKYLLATLATCIAVVFVGGVLHVVKMGSNRIVEMRDKATFDPKLVKNHIRASGEEIETHEKNEAGRTRRDTRLQKPTRCSVPSSGKCWIPWS